MIDMHNHSTFSIDSKSKMEEIVENAMKKGMKSVAITDHIDFDLDNHKTFNIDEYFKKIELLKQKYSNDIRIFKGLEMGIDLNKLDDMEKYVNDNKFEYKLASVHTVFDQDIYYLLRGGKDEEEVLLEYMNILFYFVSNFDQYDAIGHIDYPRRYSTLLRGNLSDRNIKYYEPILEKMIKNKKIIEVNTSGSHSYGDEDYPNDKFLKFYKDLGGKYVVLGSDSHNPDNISSGIMDAYKRIKKIGLEIDPRFL
jgi:histidinol-phosphatase (PHP family)